MNKMNKKTTSLPRPKGEEPKTPEPQKQEMTEDQAFMVYINQLMTSVIMENENAKSTSIEAIKNIGQRLNVYMREVSKLTKENEVLRKQIDELKKNTNESKTSVVN